MASGGARNRSGPAPNPNSGRSDRRGFKLRELPAGGYDGPIPKFPLPPNPDEDIAAREADVWEWVWRTPQAYAWAQPSEAWRIPTIGMYVRVRVRCEDPDAGATLMAQLHRFADQIGMTTAGLSEMGWQVSRDNNTGHEVSTSKGKRKGGGSRGRMTDG